MNSTTRMNPGERVLVVGSTDLASSLSKFLTNHVLVSFIETAAETEGRNVDVVVVAGDYPLEELTEVRVHPRLCDRPVVLVAPGHRMNVKEWEEIGVWPVTTPLAQEEIVDLINELLARARHPSAKPAKTDTAQLAAS